MFLIHLVQRITIILKKSKKENPERKEDLNPSGDDIEEKVRQMLDPSIPDVPKLDDIPETEPLEKPEKIIVIKPSTKTLEEMQKQVSAPELPSKKTDNTEKPTENIDLSNSKEKDTKSKSSKKVIIPISHHKEPVIEPAPIPIIANPKPQLINSPPTPVKRIDINSENIESLTEDNLDGKTEEKITDIPSAPTLDTQKLADGIEKIDTKTDINKDLPESIDDKKEIEIKESEIISDSDTDKAVSEIITSESDEILEIEDAVRDTDKPIVKPKSKSKFISKFIKFIKSKNAKIIVVLILLFAFIVASIYPTSRYQLLNIVGVRSSSSVLILDESTNLPLKNAEVSIGNVSAKTNIDGKAELTKLKLGKAKLKINKRAFAVIDKSIIIGWGSNPLGKLSLSPTGSQYKIKVTDLLSDMPIENASANSGPADALSDKDGLITIAIDDSDSEKAEVTIVANNYRTEIIEINLNDNSEQNVKFVPAKKHIYVSKRSGKYDIYSSYIDGKDEKLILAGSGHEKPDMVIAPHPSDNIAAYVSTRAGQKNSDGFVLSNLMIINLDDNDTTNIVASEQIKLVSWSGDRLVYAQVKSGSSANTPDRYKLISYNYKDKTSAELASSNYFNDVVAIGNTIFYAPSGAYQTETSKFYSINADGTSKKTVHDKEVWNIFRTDYDNLALAVAQQWYSFKIGDSNTVKLNIAPANQNSRVYINSPNDKHSAWLDTRDGKGVLINYDISSKSEKVIISESGLVYPIRWLNDKVIVFRINSSLQTADYAVNIDGGKALKINDVSNSMGLNRWFY